MNLPPESDEAASIDLYGTGAVPQAWSTAPAASRGRTTLAPRPMVPHAAKPVQYAIKRLFDYLTATVLIVILAPLMAAVALAVKLGSPGPVLFVAPRIGRGGHAFPCVKFRTMCHDAPELQPLVEHMNQAAGPLFKIGRDPRTTRVGHWLRILCLDELPQLFNVLAGHMSLVGPRPLPVRDCRLLPAGASRRHDVLPGITGQWQVMPDHHAPHVDIVAVDIDYVHRWSLSLDLRILAQTITLLGHACRSVVRARARSST